jgi:hypothetical protein
MAQIHYKNESLNVDLKVQLFNKDIAEKFKDDPSWKKMKELATNFSEFTVNDTSVEIHYKKSFYCLATSIAIVFILVGFIGLISKFRNKNFSTVVKVSRCSVSIWVVLAGVMMIITEGSFFIASEEKLKLASFHLAVAASLSNLQRVAVIAYKVFTILQYSFQNVMIYRPFFFRRHKSGFSKWLIRTTMAQWVVTTTIYLSGFLFLLYIRSGGDVCEEVRQRAEKWNTSIISSTYLGFLGSLLLSGMYVLGYCKEAGVKVGQNQKIEMRRTLMCCTVEILFDVSVVMYIALVTDNCLATDLYIAENFDIAGNCTEVATRLHSLDMGVAKCGVLVLASQPLFQEIAGLIFDLVIWSRCSFLSLSYSK